MNRKILGWKPRRTGLLNLKPSKRNRTVVENIFRGTVDRVELLRRTFGSEIVCPNCGGAIRLMALVKTERTIQTILFGMGFPTSPPKAIASIAEASPLKLKEEVDLEWSEEP